MMTITEGGYVQVGAISLGLLLWPLLFLTVPPTPADPEVRVSVPGNASGEIRYTVIRVTDGDTVVIEDNGVEEVVRLIGIDAPELHTETVPECFALESRLRAIELLLGKDIKFEADPSQDDRDAYGRLLRYAKLPNGRDFSEVMLKEGYAREYTHIVPYASQAEFQTAEEEAKAGNEGLWDACQ